MDELSRNYDDASKELNEAEKQLVVMRDLIKDVSEALSGEWISITARVSSMERISRHCKQPGPDGKTTNLNPEKWPSGDALLAAINKVHASWKKVDEAWNLLPAELKGIRLPPRPIQRLGS